MVSRQRGESDGWRPVRLQPGNLRDLCRRPWFGLNAQREDLRLDREAGLVRRWGDVAPAVPRLLARGRQAQLLANLAQQRVGRLFAGFDLAAGLHERRRPPLPDQEQAPAFVGQQGSRDAQPAVGSAQRSIPCG